VTHLQPRHEVLKFEACLPQHTLANTIHSRMIDMAAMETILETRLVIRTG
jgi:hypothetical protein